MAGYAAAFIWVMIIVVADRTVPRKDDDTSGSGALESNEQH
jgi:hypothetical protein